MSDDKINQLAATLKAAGLCASLYDAKNMAESISGGVKQRHAEVEAKIVEHMGTGKRDGGFEIIKEKVGEAPKPNSFVAEKLQVSEVFVNKDSLGVDNIGAEPISRIMEPELQPELEIQPEPQPEAESQSLSIFQSTSREKEAEVEPQPGPKVEVTEVRLTGEKTQELPVDKSRPRPTLTEEQKASTDITKWFYFGNK